MPASRTVVGSQVYFVLAPEVERIKIGRTKDVRLRLASLRSHSPMELELLGRMPGGATVEEYLHCTFASKRVRGEWFDAAPSIRRVAESGELPPPKDEAYLLDGRGTLRAPDLHTWAAIEQAICDGCDRITQLAFHLNLEEAKIEEHLRGMAVNGYLRGGDAAGPGHSWSGLIAA